MAKKQKKTRARRRRPGMPEEAAVLLKSARRCALCYGLSGDYREKKGQVAHLDHDRSHSNRDNLVWLCLRHHDVYDSSTSQSKGITEPELREYRDRLYVHIDQQRQAGLPLTPPASAAMRRHMLGPPSPFAYVKRLAVYKAARALLAKVYRDARVDSEDLGTFVAATDEAVFLFDSAVIAYLEELIGKAVALHSIGIRMQKRDLTDEERRIVSQEDHDLLTWFISQYAVLRTKLLPFLQLQ